MSVTKRLRCYAVSEGRQAVLDADGEDTGRTRVVSLTVGLWDVDIPREMHTDRKFTALLTTMNPDEFGQFVMNGVYELTVERK